MELSMKLKMLREKKMFSQAYVAEQLNLTRQAVSKWENGHTYQDVDNLKLLSKLYGISLDNLLKCEDEGHNDEGNDEKKTKVVCTKEEPDAITNNICKMSRETKHIYMISLSMLVLISCVIPPLAVVMGIIVIVINKKMGLSWRPLYLLCIIVILININSTYVILNNAFAFSVENSIKKIG